MGVAKAMHNLANSRFHFVDFTSTSLPEFITLLHYVVSHTTAHP